MSERTERLRGTDELLAEIERSHGIMLGLNAERDNAWLEVNRVRAALRAAQASVMAFTKEIERLKAEALHFAAVESDTQKAMRGGLMQAIAENERLRAENKALREALNSRSDPGTR